MSTWAIYSAPEGSPAPFVVVAWESAPGSKPRHGDPVFAETQEKARKVAPKGVVWKAPSKDRPEPDNLLETGTLAI